MDVWSLNLSWATQLNVRAGSERDFVAKCQEQWGREDQSKGPSDVPSCTLGALVRIARAQPDIVCLQELASLDHAQFYSEQYFDGYYPEFTSVGKSVVATFIKKGPLWPENVAEANLATEPRGLRPAQLLRLAPGVFLANVQLEHESGKQESQAKKGQKLSPNLQKLVEFLESSLAAETVTRLIVCGDLNTSKPEFEALGFSFVGTGKVKTCCYDSAVWRAGDYVLDSEPVVKPLARPKGWPDPGGKRTPLRTSDHAPVHAILKPIEVEETSEPGSESESESEESEAEEVCVSAHSKRPAVLGLVKGKGKSKGKSKSVWILDAKGQVKTSTRKSKPTGLEELTKEEAEQAAGLVDCGLESDTSWVQVGSAWLGQKFLGAALYKRIESMDSDDEDGMRAALKEKLPAAKWKAIQKHVK